MKYCLITSYRPNAKNCVWYIIKCLLSKIIISKYSGKEQFTFVDGIIISHSENIDLRLGVLIGYEAPNFYTNEYNITEHNSLNDLISTHFEFFL